ncbi:hypothetical protein FRACYDRAFT_250074 [Fragilariopsis cylindrus CCMP1102]|uniref:Fe2OG dioxygenase domain-containing protein n=1 Tax=Fragilariopsis cylindrus CCMP1102 TaxID=635003 RepID=A0A1E7EQW1_9STRA|nr:hypothetical protein FRACYDRAFT_250074 [Fragilariopsis cylindrus CCMP1102]|eukprot:OEU08285.1 hypothetical protein FRACYDRAFT_250074 [Fragilariopsis cylindrus CCMP1102]
MQRIWRVLAIKITLLLHLFRQRYNHEDDESRSTRSSSIIVAVNAFIVTTAVKTAVHHQFRKRYIDITGLKSSGDDDDDRWGEAVARTEDFQRNWDSDALLLPLPENTNDQTIKAKSYAAMLGSKPTALDGRCNINFNYNNNNTTGSNSSNGNNSSTVQWLHVDPPVFVVDNFLTKIECQDILQLTKQQLPSDAGRVIRLESRTTATTSSASTNTTRNIRNRNRNRNRNKRISTTWYVRYGCSAVAPILNELIKLLPSINVNQIEEIQLVQYSGQKQGFAWHEDALLDDDNDEHQEQVEQTRGGQRIATVLVYLDNECQHGSGRTLFRDLIGNNANNSRLAVSPKIGRALLFFPAITTGEQSAKSTTNTNINSNAFGNVHSFDNTRADHRTIHAGEPPIGGRNRNEDSELEDSLDSELIESLLSGQKHIAQLWIHSKCHTPVVFGRGLNKHNDATKNINILRRNS